MNLSDFDDRNTATNNRSTFLFLMQYLHFVFPTQVSAFSTWDKELHKIVFDPRYLLLNPKERKQVQYFFGLQAFSLPLSSQCRQHLSFVVVSHFFFSLQVFDQYVKTRAEEERKEKKNKLMQAKDDFRRMMEESKLTAR